MPEGGEDPSPILTDEKLEFIAAYTATPKGKYGELRKHLIQVWNEIRAQTHAYKCIQHFMFLEPRITRVLGYDGVLAAIEAARATGGGPPPPRVADVGCCFGTDTRQLLLAGCRPEDLVALDVDPAYYEAGMRLYFDDEPSAKSRSIHRVKFITASAVANDFFDARPELRGAFDFVYAGAVLHVLSEADVAAFVERMRQMLKPGGGGTGSGTLFGSCVGIAEGKEGEWDGNPVPGGTKLRYIHCRSSLEKLLRSVGFGSATVHEITRESTRVDTPGNIPREHMRYLQFSATV